MRVLSLMLVGLAVAACASGTAGRRQDEPTTVVVDNRAFADMTVYVVEGAGSRRRLGTAPGVSTTVFTIPASIVGFGREIQFIVDPIGSTRTALSNRMWVSPGDRVSLVIPPS